ncbi:tetratricopeptide repeat protein [Saccharibacillus sp. CPCC 101409]|uniref:tetratricopeptide repeat protein n=1 Tax=Saccharibacillus sp. CPCC 101409 TaxID=3058041 RepID=UPI002673C198|nr:tetratricopeptide repeat protein [Saccharibacillus sp. CPCC 101409]MDO3412261.1 tetratricopeptide repeat protein [Saccharibacillus sp. CPCC 101409]
MEASYSHYGLGMEALDAGRMEEAIRHFNASLTEGEHFATHMRLYECYKRLNAHEPAKKHIQQAYALNDRSDKVSLEYARTLHEAGSIAQARDVLQKILSRNPSYFPARQLLSDENPPMQ